MKSLKEHLIEIFDGRSVHGGLDQAIANIPFEYWGKQINNVPYTLYELLEHLRLSNRDILEYMISSNYQEMQWPEDYWPKASSPTDQNELSDRIHSLKTDIEKIRALIKENSLLDPLPYGSNEHTVAREIMILSNHLAYHLGQFILMRRLLKIWD